MHGSAYEEIRGFSQLLPANQALKIGDIGAYDVNGNVRPLFSNPVWKYVGMDVAQGRNVDVVLASETEWANIKDEEFDVVVSISTLEHTQYPWLFMRELARILRPGGLLCVNAPYQWDYHEHPVDCWRIFPDGMRAVMKFNGLTVLSAYLNRHGDTTGIATKGQLSDLLDPKKPIPKGDPDLAANKKNQ